jgi:hypothetical protein
VFLVRIIVASAANSPLITSALGATATVGTPFSYLVTASNSPTSFNVGALPPGLAFNGAANQIAGTPTTPGTFPVTLSANNAAGTGASAQLTLTIAAAGPVPVVTSATTAAGALGTLFTYQIAATNSPTSFSAAGLPLDLTLNPTTGLISGTPLSASVATVTLRAANASGTGPATTLTVVLGATPLITSAATLNLVLGQAMTPFRLVGTNAPISFNVSGLPAGLAIDTSAGLISGTPTALGVFPATVSANNTVGTGPVTTFTITVQAGPLPYSRLVSLSSRAWVNDPAGDAGVLIAGFVIGGADPKPVLLRGIGPSLAGYGVHNPLADPRLILYDATGHVLLENDNWGGTAALVATQARLGAFALDPASKDAALLVTLAPGIYTMRVAANGGQGVALAEVYDASDNPPSQYQRLIDIATRGPVGADEGVLIGGFVIAGNSPKKVLVRGVGPGLVAYGLPGALADPLLKVYDATGTPIAQNDQWETSVPLTAAQTNASPADLADAFTRTGAFALAHGSKDAALIVVLNPGAYTAIVSGVNAQTGVALVEIYEIPEGN